MPFTFKQPTANPDLPFKDKETHKIVKLCKEFQECLENYKRNPHNENQLLHLEAHLKRIELNIKTQHEFRPETADKIREEYHTRQAEEVEALKSNFKKQYNTLDF